MGDFMKRGLIIDVPNKVKNSMFVFTIWVLYILNRYRIFDILCVSTVLGIMAVIFHDASVFFVGLIFYEIFLLSIAFHEACHMKCARMFEVESKKILLIPSELGIRTAFDKNRIMTELEFSVVLLAGPITPLFFSIPFIILGVTLKIYIIFIIIAFFTFINILSLLPLKGSDGERVVRYFRTHKGIGRSFWTTMFVFFLWNLKILKFSVEKETNE